MYLALALALAVSILCGSVDGKGIHLPVVGHIFQREKEREIGREIESEKERASSSINGVALYGYSYIHIYI